MYVYISTFEYVFVVCERTPVGGGVVYVLNSSAPPFYNSLFNFLQISSSAIRTRLVSSDVQEDSDSDDAEALIIEINEEDPRKRFQELDIRSCLQFLLELYEQWLSPFVIPKTPLMLKTEAVKSVGGFLYDHS